MARHAHDWRDTPIRTRLALYCLRCEDHVVATTPRSTRANPNPARRQALNALKAEAQQRDTYVCRDCGMHRQTCPDHGEYQWTR